MAELYIGLGGNLGHPPETFRDALRQLNQHGIQTQAVSSVYRTAPVGPQDQPDFYNAVVHAHTRLSPEQALARLLDTERAFGRERLRHWGERTLDLDLLLYDSVEMTSDRLTLPHPRLHERAFVLVPLADIAPDLIVPGQQQSVTQLLEQCNRDGVWYHGPLET